MERLVPKLFKKVGYSFIFITKKFIAPTGETRNFDDLAREALWIATSESKNETKILKRASSLIVKWLSEDIPHQRHKKNKRHPVPTEDRFQLPWGERIAEAAIKSGEKGPLAVAIEPTPTDQGILEQDAADYLLKILNYTLEWWGPQALVWLVVCMMNNYKYLETMRILGKEVNQTLIRQAERSVPKIKLDIQSKFGDAKW